MAAARASALCVVLLAVMAAGGASAQLSTGFYSSSCPGALGAVASVVQSAVANEPCMGASILRLFFHDCFVQGCDGLLLLDDTASFQGEKMATPNNGSVADEIYSELKSMAHIGQGFDEKNIRRGVYDAFNVLIALRVIAKEKKEIRWMGLSNYRYEKLKKLEEVRKELVNKIRHKKALLQEIEKQFDDLQNIKLRNETLQSSAENVNGIRLPFVLVKTSRKARVEIEISEDSKFAHFEFNGAPFTLHDDLSILEGIRRNSIGRAGRATLH